MTATVLNTNISEVENKIPNTFNLVTTTVFNTKISEVENKIPNHDKYITTPEFNKLTTECFAARLKQADSVNKTDFDNKLKSFNKRIPSDKAKHLEVQEKLNSLTTKDYNFSLDRIYFTSNDGSQNTFIYQPTVDFRVKKDKRSDCILSWKSKGGFNSKLKPLYNIFVNSIKLSEYRVEIKFNKDPLAIKHNNYLTKIVNFCIVYDLDV